MADGMLGKGASADWANVHARGRLLNRGATMQTTPSAASHGIQSRPANSSASITSRGPKMRGFDPDFAACRPLKPFDFLGGFVGFPVSWPTTGFLNAVRALFSRRAKSRQRSEQNLCCRERRTIVRPQTSQRTGASRRGACGMLSDPLSGLCNTTMFLVVSARGGAGWFEQTKSPVSILRSSCRAFLLGSVFRD